MALTNARRRRVGVDGRECSRCGEHRDWSHFSLDKNQPTGRRPECKTCRSLYLQAYRRRDHVRVRATHAVRKYRYGMDEAQFLDLLEEQGGVCAVCQKPESAKDANGNVRALSVDHDHFCCPGARSSCGQCIRGLLCSNCNRGIGHLQDDPDLLLDAALYVLATSNAALRKVG